MKGLVALQVTEERPTLGPLSLPRSIISLDKSPSLALHPQGESQAHPVCFRWSVFPLAVFEV